MELPKCRQYFFTSYTCLHPGFSVERGWLTVISSAPITNYINYFVNLKSEKQAFHTVC